MSDLFQQAASPLAEKLRPQKWGQLLGQSDVIRKVRTGLHSMILYGPPGCGKTTLARILARESKLEADFLSAISCSVKDVRSVIEKVAVSGRRILFLDEIHRFNKAQQDALLDAVETGKVILIGATTENPSFAIIPPLLSRTQVYRLASLDSESLGQILERALNFVEEEILIAEESKQLITDAAGGDARKLLQLLEICIQNVKPEKVTGPIQIENDLVQSVLAGKVRMYDRQGQNHYDFISAFIKSMRGSDPDATLVYLACMIEAGEDPLFIARRMIIFASEDIGNASVQALNTAVSCYQAVERIGMPEGRIVLAQTAIFLACSPKSNASYLAIDNAMNAVRQKTITIPDHLRNAPTQTHRNEGAKRGYKYPHDYDGHFVAENYHPKEIGNRQFYFPTEQGQEARITERLRELNDRKLKSPEK